MPARSVRDNFAFIFIFAPALAVHRHSFPQKETYLEHKAAKCQGCTCSIPYLRKSQVYVPIAVQPAVHIRLARYQIRVLPHFESNDMYNTSRVKRKV